MSGSLVAEVSQWFLTWSEWCTKSPAVQRLVLTGWRCLCVTDCFLLFQAGNQWHPRTLPAGVLLLHPLPHQHQRAGDLLAVSKEWTHPATNECSCGKGFLTSQSQEHIDRQLLEKNIFLHTLIVLTSLLGSSVNNLDWWTVEGFGFFSPAHEYTLLCATHGTVEPLARF